MKKIYSVMILCVAVVTSMLFVSCERDIVPTETVLSVIDEEITPSYTTCKVTCSFYTDATIEYASVQYSTTEDFARYNVTKMTKNTDDGSYSVELTKLQANTTYYFRYEVNACVFTSSTADIVSEFQTLQTSIPVVTTTLVTNLSYTSATVNGQITFDGGCDITEYGIVYGTSQDPTIENTKIKSNKCDSTGTFVCEVKNLQANTTYYARAYAKNAQGVAYGEEVTFTTLQLSVPVLIASVVIDSPTSVTINGQISQNGGSEITECGVVYSTSHNPTTANNQIKSDDSNSEGLFTCQITGLQRNATYYARAYAINAKGIGYSLEISFKPDHPCVDLGLSVKWATYNVGATKPGEYGDYFAWGETTPKSSYASSTYTYSSTPGVLPLSNDAARANWGGSWRMPTEAEQDELGTKCTWTWTAQDGTYGCKVTSKSNGNSIFLPAAGYRYESSLSGAGNYGEYWSSSLYAGDSRSAYYLFFHSGSLDWRYQRRYYGSSVRPVCP